MRRRWQASKEAEIAEMKALAAAYRGKVTRCPPGVARGHRAKPQDAPPDSASPSSPDPEGVED